MSAKRILVISILALFCFSPMQGPLSSHLQADDGVLEASPVSLEILMMGNSYTSANSLDSIVDGVLSAASNPANVTSLTGGGMRLSQHSSNVASAGHQWNTTLNNGVWNWVIVQDQSQIPGFPRNHQEWINSKNGAVQLAQTIDDKGADSVLMMTWGRRDGDSVNTQRFPDFSTMQDELEAGYLDYRDNMSSHGNVWVAPVGLAFEHIHDQIIADGGTPTNSGNLFYNLYSSDGSHPSISGSYLAALVIYATITGDDPVGLSHSTSLSNSVALELQQAASATVFNETSHLDYPWQTNSQNQLPPINLSAIPDGALAWEWVEHFGRHTDGLEISDVTVDHNGVIYATGKVDIELQSNFSFGPCKFPQELVIFVIKLQPDGHCSWLADVTTSQSGSSSGWVTTSITHDLQGNSYVTGYLDGGSSSKTYNFNNNNSNTISFKPTANNHGFVAKINSQGEWQWLNNYSEQRITSVGVISQNQIVVAGYISSTGMWHGAGTWLEIPFVRSIDDSGVNSWYEAVTTGTGCGSNCYEYKMSFEDLSVDGNGDILLTGSYKNAYNSGVNTYYNYSFGSFELGYKENLNNDYPATVIAKINKDGDWQWATTWNSTTNQNDGYSIDTDSNNDVFVAGAHYGEIEANGTVLSSGGNENGYVAKLDSNGSWIWLVGVDCSCESSALSIATDVHDNAIVSGRYSSPIQLGPIQLTPVAGGVDVYFAKVSGDGIWEFAIGAGTSQTDLPSSVFSDRNGNGYLAGSVDVGKAIYGGIEIQNRGGSGTDGFIAKLTSDYDFDQEPDILDIDDDGDYIIDIYDKCQFSPIGFESIAAFDHDSDGCRDSDEDDDDDDDGLNDTIDSCPKGMTGWSSSNLTDLDSDGCMDALEDFDDDADGFEDYEDYCQRIPGNSTMEYEKGCPDSDGDGRPDVLDPFADDPNEWSDKDGDGVGDNSDAFPLDATQQSDTDGDGYGDEEYGNGGDSCPTIFGNSTIDRRGCRDSDGDGWSDAGDDFPNDQNIHLDTDGDSIADHLDDFPFDPTQQSDSDGDGYGDNANGNLADAFPDDPSKHSDADRDGIDDGGDAFPYDPTQWKDTDGDGYGDNPLGIGADKFPDDASQWGDIDGDGYGDNSSGTDADAFTTDATQWSDIDGDGYGDNPAGRLYDLFPENPTQWIDGDGDGLGDNLTGDNADPYLNDFDNDGYPDNIDILPKFYSPGDLDNDGCFDDVDVFPADMRECFDNDEDGEGNNADTDDDNDGWADTDERRLGTDPFDANNVPVDSFEIVIPGTSIGLGAWDLIGMFGGLPLFAWIGFGFVTRNSRCNRYQQQLEAATTRKELEDIAIRSEYSLMLRMLGPHQGIKLERLRAELDDVLEGEENLIVQGFDQTQLIVVNEELLSDKDAKTLPELSTRNVPATSLTAENIDANGFEWIQFEGENWYRETDSNSDWSLFE